ncbi:MAG: glycosyltransferase family 4 protein [bacterium]
MACRLAEHFGPERFQMVLFDPITDERKKLGWEQNNEHEWIIGPPENETERQQLFARCMDADVMIFGECPFELLQARAKSGKLTFISGERMWKHPLLLNQFDPRLLRHRWRFRNILNNPCVHDLAMGAYAASDLAMVGDIRDRLWQWGYFVTVPATPPMVRNSDIIRVLWAGRMLDWKRVDLLITAVAQAVKVNSPIELTLIGQGPEGAKLICLVNELGLQSTIKFMPSVPAPQVREKMQQADIYVLPSNRHEGWGAVIGEAMSEGCVTIAGDQAGASRVLINDDENGYIFPDGDSGALAEIIIKVSADPALRARIGQAAWEKMHNLWHPDIAATRIIELCSGLLGLGTVPHYPDGPCMHINLNLP